MSRILCSLGLLFSPIALRPAAAEGPYSLAEREPGKRVERVEIEVNVAGTAEFAVEKGKSITHPLVANATVQYRERRLGGSGRDALALRSLRHYDKLSARYRVADHNSSSQLRADRQQIVAQGRREGLLFYSPAGLLTATELDLLRAPGDSLHLLALLPPKSVAIGEKWTPASWVGQLLTDTEAASKSELQCTLDSVEAGRARFSFNGVVEGASGGSAVSIQLKGFCSFDLKQQSLTQAHIEQTENRSIGAVSPGMKVTAASDVIRVPSDARDDLGPEAVAAVPLDPPPSLLMLEYRAPWPIAFVHDRDWHVFQQTPEVAVLRLIEKGTLVAQCNLAPLRSFGKGEHIPESQFQNDVRSSLGARMKSIEKSEVLPTDDGRFLYRVIARGEANQTPITWIYYLCAAPSGAQSSFVFAVESALRDRLGDRDLQMLKSLRFLGSEKPVTKTGAQRTGP